MFAREWYLKSLDICTLLRLHLTKTLKGGESDDTEMHVHAFCSEKCSKKAGNWHNLSFFIKGEMPNYEHMQYTQQPQRVGIVWGNCWQLFSSELQKGG